MILTIISDTHNKHNTIKGDLKGGDLLLHAGDLTSMGYEHEIVQFTSWFSRLETYHHKVFIAGNHDWGFQNNTEKVKEIVGLYDTITYLQDDWVNVGDSDPHDPNAQTVKIWGSPWQPEFMKSPACNSKSPPFKSPVMCLCLVCVSEIIVSIIS